MLLHTRQNSPRNPSREDCSSRMREPSLVALEKPSALAIPVDIDEVVASPWIGLHYRHEFLLHHRHEFLETDPRNGAGRNGTETKKRWPIGTVR